MRILIRYFFRTIRVLLAPVMLLSEKLTTPKPIVRDPQKQKEIDAQTQSLTLYQFATCPFCIRVRKEIARLGLNIEKRDAQHNETYRGELADGGGRVKVPCLRIEQDNGEIQWLYESAAINAWLKSRFE